MTYKVRYWYGCYSGVRFVTAADDDEAIAKTRAWARREGSLSMAYESYKIISANPESAAR